jgi:hypothetical protein
MIFNQDFTFLPKIKWVFFFQKRLKNKTKALLEFFFKNSLYLLPKCRNDVYIFESLNWVLASKTFLFSHFHPRISVVFTIFDPDFR